MESRSKRATTIAAKRNNNSSSSKVYSNRTIRSVDVTWYQAVTSHALTNHKVPSRCSCKIERSELERCSRSRSVGSNLSESRCSEMPLGSCVGLRESVNPSLTGSKSVSVLAYSTHSHCSECGCWRIDTKSGWRFPFLKIQQHHGGRYLTLSPGWCSLTLVGWCDMGLQCTARIQSLLYSYCTSRVPTRWWGSG